MIDCLQFFFQDDCDMIEYLLSMVFLQDECNTIDVCTNYYIQDM